MNRPSAENAGSPRPVLPRDQSFDAPAVSVGEKDPGIPAAGAHERDCPAVGSPGRRLHAELGWNEDPAPASVRLHQDEARFVAALD
jgi:hypothetical protein